MKESFERRRILLLITNLTFGGAQRVFYEQSKILSHDFDVFECVFNIDSPLPFQSGNTLINLDVKAGKNWPDKAFRFVQRVSRIRKIKKEYRIDTCISHLEGADLINVLSKRTDKVITWIHGSKKYDRNISGVLGFIRHKLLIPFAYSRADTVVTVCKSLKYELIKFYGIRSESIITIYNFFDVPAIVSKSKIELPSRYDSVFKHMPILLFSGRLTKQKNLSSLIVWFATFLKEYPCKLVLVGDGELRNELLELCIKLDLRTFNPWSTKEIDDAFNVYFLGYQENPFQFMRKSTLLVLPSLWEGFPMVIGEAMSCEVPIVSSDCHTGPREMLAEGLDIDEKIEYPFFAKNGLLLPPLTKDYEECWTQGILKLLSNKNLMEHYKGESLPRVSSFSKVTNGEKLVREIF